MANIGRITGPLLKDNLLRNGVDLAFETDLIYLNVNEDRIGLKTDSPARELEIDNHGQTTDLIVDDNIHLPNIDIDNVSNITTSNGILYLNAAQRISAVALAVDNLKIDANRISTRLPNTDLEIRPTDKLVINADTYIDAGLHATGNITFDGTIVFGNDDTDNVTFASDINSSIFPNLTNEYGLGNTTNRWKKLWANSVKGTTLTVDTMTSPSGIDFQLRFTKSLFVSVNGSDSNAGNHQNAPYGTLKHALSQATAGDTIFIFPGVYDEIAPLTVPVGVNVVGLEVRQTIIMPTEDTKYNDVFLLNGETSISDITVRGFLYDSMLNTGHAFRFAPNFKVTTKSPYIQNVSVITRGSSVTDGVIEILDGEFSNSYLDQIASGGTALTSIFEALANGGLSSNSGSFNLNDILGFNDGNAGRGAYIDGSVADPESNEASMLFHSCTFITPGVDAVVMTNGVRVEVINCFTYFANIGFYATQPSEAVGITVGGGSTLTGYTSDSVNLSKEFYSQALVDLLVGQTAVIDRYPNPPLYYTVVSIETEPFSPTLWRMTVDTTFNTAGWLKPISFYPDTEITQLITNDIWDTTGNSVGEKWVAWYKTNLPVNFNTTVQPGWTINVAGTLYSVDYVIEDPLNSTMWRIYVTTSLVAGVGIPIFSSSTPVATGGGVEVRSIASANVYGNYGAVADGVDTLMYLIGHNFGYIGSGLDSSNDKTLAIQANETVELNTGKIYYTSQAQDGDFRVGDQFYIDLENGLVSFETSGIAANGASSLTFQGVNSRLFIDASKIELGDFRLSGNTIETLTQPFNLLASNGQTTFADNVQIGKNLLITGDLQTDGTLTFGNQAQDTVTFNTELSQNLNPKTTNLFDIGASGKIWRDIYIASIKTQDISVNNNRIETTLTDSNLLLSGNGTGNTRVESLEFGNSTITSTVLNSNIVLAPASNSNLIIASSTAFRVPRTTTQLNRIGEVRFNTSTGLFDGFSTALVGFGGVYSADRQTSLLAHPTNNTLIFRADNVVTTVIDSTGLTTNALFTDNLQLNNNTITAVGTNDLVLVADSVNVQNLTINDNTISPTTSNANLELGTTGLAGYVQFTGTGALEFPVGDNASRPPSPVLGNTRFNPEVQYTEVWNGSAWIPVTGVGELSTFEYANEQTTLWSIILG
jgi:hypothetical protein